MPTYLLHGFRWDRVSIRVHIVVHDLEDAAPEWIVAPATSVTLLNSFYTLFDFLPPSNPPPATYPADKAVLEDEPGTRNRTWTRKDAKNGSRGSLRGLVRRPMGGTLKGGRDREEEFRRATDVDGHGALGNGNDHPTSNSPRPRRTRATTTFNDWSAVKLVEQHDPDDLASVSQPHAYVADYMVEIPLGASLAEEMAKYEAKIREEEAPLSTPGTPGSNRTSNGNGNGNDKKVHTPPPLSARKIRMRSRRLGWIEKLRDGLQKGEDVGWFVVVCGDEERKAPSLSSSVVEEGSRGSEEVEKHPRSAGFMGFFGKRKTNPDG